MYDDDIELRTLMQKYNKIVKKSTILDSTKCKKYAGQKEKKKKYGRMAEKYENKVKIMY